MARATPQSGDDAIALLKADHATVKKLFKEFEDADEDDEKQAIAELICKLLTVHATIEEELFYPAARAVLDQEDLIDEAEVEHATAKDLIAKIEVQSEPYDANVKVLGEYIDHHVKEEQDQIFPQAKKAGLDTKGLGKSLLARKTELLAEIGLTAEGEEMSAADDEDEESPKAGSRGRKGGRDSERRPIRTSGSAKGRTSARTRR